MTKNAPRQAILEATITCIEKYGVDKTTTRKIAQEAGANIAAINYYFRSKDDLIAQALKTTLDHMTEDLTAILQDEQTPFEKAFQDWMLYLLDGAQRFPNIMMAHMVAPIVEKRYDTVGVQAIRQLFDQVAVRAKCAYPEKDEAELRRVLMDVISMVIFRVLAPGFFTDIESYSSEELAKRFTIVFNRAISTF
jgi:AcrR family transcriptional regulator